MLKVARERGIVEIRIHHPLRTAPELEQRLLAALPLSDTLVLAADRGIRGVVRTERDASDEVARQLGALTARYLDERIADHAIVGVGWGSTVYHVVTSGYFRRKQGISVVQLMGSVGGATPDIDGGQVASRLGQALGGEDLLPAGSDGRHGCRACGPGCCAIQHIRKTLEMARRANVLLVSVGAVTQASGIFRAGLSQRVGSRIHPGPGCRRRHLRRVLPAGWFALLPGAGRAHCRRWRRMPCAAPRCGSASAGAPRRRCPASARSAPD